MTENTDAYWCGRLSQGIREALREMSEGSVTRCRRELVRVLADYDQNSGFPRLVNGSVYFSSRWLDAYESDDPKHPDFHDTYATLHDNREGK